jgi:hypothetical protein
MHVTELPTMANLKPFMVFDGIPENISFLFNGTLEHFSKTYITVQSWEEVVAWAKEEGYTLIPAGTAEYARLESEIEDEDFDLNLIGLDDIDRIFDDGGHTNVDRYFEFADTIRDRNRDGG